VHEGGYRVDAEGRFFYPWGGEVAAAPRLPRSDVSTLLERTRPLRLDTSTCASGSGERLDLASAVDALLAIERRAARAREPATPG